MGGQYCGNILPALKSHVIVIVSTQSDEDGFSEC